MSDQLMNAFVALAVLAVIGGAIWVLRPRSKNASKGPKRGGGVDENGPSGPIADQ